MKENRLDNKIDTFTDKKRNMVEQIDRQTDIYRQIDRRVKRQLR